MIEFKSRNNSGRLVPIESGRDLPFDIVRVFFVTDVPIGETRGKHAHKQCSQVLVCLNGECLVECDDGSSKRTFVLDSPDQGLLIPPSIWASQCVQ